MTRVEAQPIVAAIRAKLLADLPDSYQVFGAEGAADPQSSCPYVVLYGDGGTPEGAPMAPSRALTGLFAVRAVGLDDIQAGKGADRVGAALHDYTSTVDGRQLYVWQDSSQPIQRDDSTGPPALFEQLLIFGFRSDP